VRATGWAVLALVIAGMTGCAAATAPPASPPPEPTPEPSAPEVTADPEPEISPELLAGDRVADIRVAQEPISMMVGESISMISLEPTPVDEDGVPVEGVALLGAPLTGAVASLASTGEIVGLQEGETELVLAVMAPNSEGLPEPRMFPIPIVVRGAPVASLEVAPPELAVYTGTAVPFAAEARTASGDVRTRVEVSWSSRNPDIASVSEGGFVRGLRAGSAALVAEAEGIETVHVVQVLENPVRSIELSPDVAEVRTGDVVRFVAVPRDSGGAPVTDIALTYAVGGEGLRSALGASVYEDGAFVAEEPGNYRVVASAGNVSADAVAEVRSRDVQQEPVRVGVGLV
jgi:hypothetical protein